MSLPGGLRKEKSLQGREDRPKAAEMGRRKDRVLGVLGGEGKAEEYFSVVPREDSGGAQGGLGVSDKGNKRKKDKAQAEAEEDDLVDDEEKQRRVRKKRKAGRKCAGMCYGAPPLPQSLVQLDAKTKREKKNKKAKERKKE